MEVVEELVVLVVELVVDDEPDAGLRAIPTSAQVIELELKVSGNVVGEEMVLVAVSYSAYPPNSAKFEAEDSVKPEPGVAVAVLVVPTMARRKEPT